MEAFMQGVGGVTITLVLMGAAFVAAIHYGEKAKRMAHRAQYSSDAAAWPRDQG